MNACDLYFGGSFDPIHNGHLFAAQEAANAVGDATVLFVPTRQNPLKPGPTTESADHRLEMLRTATGTNPAFYVSSAEAYEPGPSYTEHTVRGLIERGALVARPGLIIGDDLIGELPRWRSVETLMGLVYVVIVSRNGVDRTELPSFLPSDSIIVKNPEIPVSSTTLRERLRAGLSVRYLVPESTYEYIQQHSLYIQHGS